MTVEHTTDTGPKDKSATVSLEVLAKMTGFPLELIKEEVFNGSDKTEVSLNELRSAMLSYIDSTIFIDEKGKD